MTKNEMLLVGGAVVAAGVVAYLALRKKASAGTSETSRAADMALVNEQTGAGAGGSVGYNQDATGTFNNQPALQESVGNGFYSGNQTPLGALGGAAAQFAPGDAAGYGGPG